MNFTRGCCVHQACHRWNAWQTSEMEFIWSLHNTCQSEFYSELLWGPYNKWKYLQDTDSNYKWEKHICCIDMAYILDLHKLHASAIWDLWTLILHKALEVLKVELLFEKCFQLTKAMCLPFKCLGIFKRSILNTVETARLWLIMTISNVSYLNIYIF